MAWGPWKDHDDSGMPSDVTPTTLVRVKMAPDGDVLSPMLAEDINWCFPGDPVDQYQVHVSGAAADLINSIKEVESA